MARCTASLVRSSIRRSKRFPKSTGAQATVDMELSMAGSQTTLAVHEPEGPVIYPAGSEMRRLRGSYPPGSAAQRNDVEASLSRGSNADEMANDDCDRGRGASDKEYVEVDVPERNEADLADSHVNHAKLARQTKPRSHSPGGRNKIEARADNAAVNRATGTDVPDGRGGHRRQKSGLSPKRRPHQEEVQHVPEAHAAVYTHRQSGCMYVLAVFALGALLAQGVIILKNSHSANLSGNANQVTHPYSTAPEQFTSVITSLQAVLDSQPDRTWKALSTRGAHHLREAKPNQPAVFLLAGEPAAHKTLACLASRLSKAFSNESVARIDSAVIADRAEGDGDRAQSLLHTELQEHLRHVSEDLSPGRGTKTLPVFIVERLELLPAPSPFLFFSYCDSSDAVSTHSVFIFTLQLPAAMDGLSVGASSEKERERRVLNYLAEEVWPERKHTDYMPSSVEALIARVSDLTVIVHEETSDELLGACPASGS